MIFFRRPGLSGIFCLLSLLLSGGAFGGASTAGPRVLHVGRGQPYASIAAVASVARDGDVVEIEAGDYLGDVAVWNQKKLTLRGVHGRVRLMAAGAAAEGKAIWVIRDGDFLVENIEFSGARVADHNGAGIRFEHGHLVVRNCVFVGNEMGLLTSDDKKSVLDIEGSEFGPNAFRDDRNHHNLYVGQIARLSVTASYFHHGREGHLLKTRAQVNFIYYNRLTDELGGRASYELEFANGGVAYVVGNILQQSATSENPHLISFGAEGYVWPRNELYLVNNTLVDDKPRNGIFLRVRPGAQVVRGVNNVLIGEGELDSTSGKELAVALMKAAQLYVQGKSDKNIGLSGGSRFENNPHAKWTDVALEPFQDYRLRAQSSLVGKSVDPGPANGANLTPTREYVHPRQSRPLPGGAVLSPGAPQEIVTFR